MQGYDGAFIFGEVNADIVSWAIIDYEMKAVKVNSNR